MGFLRKSKGGWICDPSSNPDGTRTCRRVETEKGQRVATGTEINIGVDPNTCEPIFSGDAQMLMDEDEKQITNIAHKMTSQCKKDRGL